MMHPDQEKPAGPNAAPDSAMAPDSDTESSADSAQGERNNPAINEAKTGSTVNEPTEG